MSARRSLVRERAARRQIEVFRAYIAKGSIKLAAHELGISGSTAPPASVCALPEGRL
jgi:hypothetical protein